MTAEEVVAINVGATLGIVGKSQPMTPALVAALPEMYVVFSVDGYTWWRKPASALMGHPLQPLVWLVAALQAEGRRLEAGDVVSLGSFGPPLSIPVVPADEDDWVGSAEVSYVGASGATLLPDVSVRFGDPQP